MAHYVSQLCRTQHCLNLSNVQQTSLILPYSHISLFLQNSGIHAGKEDISTSFWPGLQVTNSFRDMNRHHQRSKVNYLNYIFVIAWPDVTWIFNNTSKEVVVFLPDRQMWPLSKFLSTITRYVIFSIWSYCTRWPIITSKKKNLESLIVLHAFFPWIMIQSKT